jgi:hypothetical protein
MMDRGGYIIIGADDNGKPVKSIDPYTEQFMDGFLAQGSTSRCLIVPPQAFDGGLG